MKKLFLTALAVSFLAGCASTPPPPIEPLGDLKPVNPVNVNFSDLRTE